MYHASTFHGGKSTPCHRVSQCRRGYPSESLTRMRACHQHSMRDSQRRLQISGMFYHMRL